MLPASLRTGTTTLTAGVLAWFMICCARGFGVAHVLFRGPASPSPGHALPSNGASFLWGEEAAGNPLDAWPGGARQRMRGALGVDLEAEVAPCEPVAHQERANAAHKGAGDHVAQIVGIEGDAACRDDQRIDQH